MKNKLTTQPYKGSRDFYPENFRKREYIFNIWRDACKSFGYKEFDGPFLESFDLYASKSGDELVNEQLYSFEDRGGRKVAIRPEMTPTLARMIAGKYKELTRPIRWFSIPNLWRYEKPQRGRLREFFQLNIDILGIEGPEADFEILMSAIDIMKRAGAKEGMFELRLNDRRFMDDFYADLGVSGEQKVKINKAMDKKLKVSQEDFEKMLKDTDIQAKQVDKMLELLDKPFKILDEFASKDSIGAKSIQTILKMSEDAGTTGFIKFDPTIVRGLAYYTGTVFEQFDLNPKNNRAMFGGGRYDDLVTLFIDEKIPATGFGMGDVTFLDFLESWDLLPNFENETEYFITRWPTENEELAKEFAEKGLKIATKLRNEGKTVEMWLENNTKIDKQLKYANKKGFKKVVILGEEELKNNQYLVKDMTTREQNAYPIG